MIRRLIVFAAAAAACLALAAASICVRGATLPAEHTSGGEADVAAPPARVFARIADPARYPAWRKDVVGVRIVAAGRWVEQTSQGTLPYRFGKRLEPGTLETIVDSTSLPFSGSWTFELRPIPGGTRVRITERGRIASLPLRALAPVFSPPDRTLRRYLADLRASFASE